MSSSCQNKNNAFQTTAVVNEGIAFPLNSHIEEKKPQ